MVLDAWNDAFVRTVQPIPRALRPGARPTPLLTCRKALALTNPRNRPPFRARVASAPCASLEPTFANVRVAARAVAPESETSTMALRMAVWAAASTTRPRISPPPPLEARGAAGGP